MDRFYSYDAVTLAYTVTKSGTQSTGTMSACRVGDLLPHDGEPLSEPRVFLPVTDPTKSRPVVTWEPVFRMNMKLETSSSSCVMAKTRNGIHFLVHDRTPITLFTRAKGSIYEQAVVLNDAETLLNSSVKYHVLSPMIPEPRTQVGMKNKSVTFPGFNPVAEVEFVTEAGVVSMPLSKDIAELIARVPFARFSVRRVGGGECEAQFDLHGYDNACVTTITDRLFGLWGKTVERRKDVPYIRYTSTPLVRYFAKLVQFRDRNVRRVPLPAFNFETSYRKKFLETLTAVLERNWEWGGRFVAQGKMMRDEIYALASFSGVILVLPSIKVCRVAHAPYKGDLMLDPSSKDGVDRWWKLQGRIIGSGLFLVPVVAAKKAETQGLRWVSVDLGEKSLIVSSLVW